MYQKGVHGGEGLLGETSRGGGSRLLARIRKTKATPQDNERKKKRGEKSTAGEPTRRNDLNAKGAGIRVEDRGMGVSNLKTVGSIIARWCEISTTKARPRKTEVYQLTTTDCLEQ